MTIERAKWKRMTKSELIVELEALDRKLCQTVSRDTYNSLDEERAVLKEDLAQARKSILDLNGDLSRERGDHSLTRQALNREKRINDALTTATLGRRE